MAVAAMATTRRSDQGVHACRTNSRWVSVPCVNVYPAFVTTQAASRLLEEKRLPPDPVIQPIPTRCPSRYQLGAVGPTTATYEPTCIVY
jgi:hypothetical protein